MIDASIRSRQNAAIPRQVEATRPAFLNSDAILACSFGGLYGRRSRSAINGLYSFPDHGFNNRLPLPVDKQWRSRLGGSSQRAEHSSDDEVGPHIAAIAVRKDTCAMVDVVQSRSHRLSDHSAFHLALIAFVCAVMVLLSGSSPTSLAGTDRLSPQIESPVEQLGAPNQTAAPTISTDIRFSENLHDQVGEFLEPADDDETERCLPRSNVALRLDVPAFASQSGLYESSADRAPTPFRLRAFPSRGTPSA